MRDENAFNAHVAKELKKLERLGPNFTYYVKVADKFRAGISDFIIWRGSKCVVMENKFIADWPAMPNKLLKHIFEGDQITFLESIDLSGNRAWGLVGVGSVKRMFLMPWSKIPKDGNWITEDFIKERFLSFAFNEVDEMVAYMTG